jgi:hypothetical protein
MLFAPALALVVLTAAQGPAKPAAKPAPSAAAKGTKPVEPTAPTAQNGPGALDEPRKIAEAYLRALEGKGTDDAKNYLLGGLTLTAQDFTIPNWKIVSRDAPRIEEKSIAAAVKEMWALDKVGAEALTNVVVAEDSSLSLSQADAEKLLGPTRAHAALFEEKFPLFSYVGRSGRDVFWHPENPWRKEVKKLGKEGNYTLELHRFTIEEKEKDRPARQWPLRVLRVKTKTYDSGWKILPASDWDPNY